MKAFSRVALAVAGAVLVAAGGLTCTDFSTGPGRSLVRLGVAPTLSIEASAIYRQLAVFSLPVNNVHVQLTRGSGATAADTTVEILAGQDSVVMVLGVSIAGGQETLEALIELRSGTTVLFSGTQSVTAKLGSSPAQPTIPVEYVGPGATATTLVLAPADTAIRAADSVIFRATGRDQNGQSVPDLALVWTVKDPQRGTVSASGVFKPSPGRGTTYVIARLPTSVRDSARVRIEPTPTQTVLISGGGQSGPVGATLAQPIVFEVRADDQLPVSGVPVTFTVTAGAGSLSASNATSDAAPAVVRLHV